MIWRPSLGDGMVYPRWRGEHAMEAWNACRTAGLSPLARGTLGDIPQLSYSDRFIPAGAGNTISAEKRSIADTVYPRWRGEHITNVR